MNAEEIAHYQELCQKYSLEIDFNYKNAHLDQLMNLGIWGDILYKQLNSNERKIVRSYINNLKFPTAGLVKSQIVALERIVEKCALLAKKELNSRWAVRNTRTGLYWCSMIQPCWGTSRKAFLFLSEKEAQHWVNRFIKVAKEFEFEVLKLDATKRLERCSF